MSQNKISFASDNWAPVHPAILQAVMDANQGPAAAYGGDPWTLQAKKLIEQVFKRKCQVFITSTGTGSNILAYRLSCKPYESIICTDIAHVDRQESGATEALVGAKLLSVPHEEGKATPEKILKKLQKERAIRPHSTSPRLLSITQSTEVGTVYTLAELAALGELCKRENLLLHIDGSRLYNAAASLNVSLADIAEASQVDILSLGGTKNGLMGVEALVIFNPLLEEGADHLQKQTLQLSSKMRYLSSQYIPFFEQNLWKTLAVAANEKAEEMASIIRSIPSISINYPVHTNQLFISLPPSSISAIQEKVSCHLWDQEKNEVRLIASWNTSQEDIRAFKLVFDQL